MGMGSIAGRRCTGSIAAHLYRLVLETVQLEPRITASPMRAYRLERSLRQSAAA